MLGVHAIAADKPVGQPVEAIVVESVDVTPIRARAATVVAALGGRVVDSVQDGAVALGGRAGGVEPKVALPRSFFVEVPTASVAEFKAQLASASVEKQLGDRSRAMGGGAPAPSRPAAKAQAMQERLMEERSELAFKRKEPVPMTRIEIRVVAPAEKK
jgi:hypothetical protein